MLGPYWLASHGTDTTRGQTAMKVLGFEYLRGFDQRSVPLTPSHFDPRRLARRLSAFLLASVGVLLTAGGASAQVTAETFDLRRAWFGDEVMFVPFQVEETRLLRDALADGTVKKETALLVFEHEIGTLAFLTQQLAYHHIAQGDIAGEPWMVSF